MVQLAFAFVAAALVSVQASPFLGKRINQNTVASTAKWETLCQSTAIQNSPEFENCNPLAVKAFGTLLANAGPCDQQNAADNLVDLSKQLSSTEMVTLAQIFVQQPRNSPTSQSVPYCQQAPRNSELKGLHQCQFQGVSLQIFVGGLTVGQSGTIPFGSSEPVSPPGSCPANPEGPIADGQQLSDITTDPLASGSSSTAADSESESDDDCPAPSATQSPTSTVILPSTGTSMQSNVTAASTTQSPTPATPSSTGSALDVTQQSTTAPAATSPSSGFQATNGQNAQKLNAQYATLTADSPCDAGNIGCVNLEFAQCVNGKFVLEPCAPTLGCYALPLVNSLGTSTTCTTEADATQRISNSGATGGITGSGS